VHEAWKAKRGARPRDNERWGQLEAPFAEAWTTLRSTGYVEAQLKTYEEGETWRATMRHLALRNRYGITTGRHDDRPLRVWAAHTDLGLSGVVDKLKQRSGGAPPRSSVEPDGVDGSDPAVDGARRLLDALAEQAWQAERQRMNDLLRRPPDP
jgi:hypothetical protein